MLPCLLYRPLSDPPLSCLSCMCLSGLGLSALFLFSLECPHIAFFSLCAPVSFSSHGRTTSVVFLNFLGYLRHSCCSSKATVTPDRTIYGSYDWLRLGQGATDRQFLLRSPAAITNDLRISIARAIAGNRATSNNDQRLRYD